MAVAAIHKSCAPTASPFAASPAHADGDDADCPVSVADELLEPLTTSLAVDQQLGIDRDRRHGSGSVRSRDEPHAGRAATGTNKTRPRLYSCPRC